MAETNMDDYSWVDLEYQETFSPLYLESYGEGILFRGGILFRLDDLSNHYW